MNDRATTLLAGRREKLEHALGRPLAVPEPASGAELSESERDQENESGSLGAREPPEPEYDASLILVQDSQARE